MNTIQKVLFFSTIVFFSYGCNNDDEGETKELNFMWAKEDSQLKDIPASYFYH